MLYQLYKSITHPPEPTLESSPSANAIRAFDRKSLALCLKSLDIYHTIHLRCFRSVKS